MGALSRKTVLLVTHQVDFLPVFDSILVSYPLFSSNVSFSHSEKFSDEKSLLFTANV